MKMNEITACKALFFCISFFVGLWTVRIPNVKDLINVDYTGMGYTFIVFSIGSLITMVLAPKIISKFNSKYISLIAGYTISVLWLIVPFNTSLLIMFVLSLIFGACYGIFEVILNLQASNLEKKYNKTMMSSFHAFWSIGLLSGSILTSIFLEFEISFIFNSITFVILLFPLIYLGSLTLVKSEPDQKQSFSVFFKWPIIVVIFVFFSITAVFLEGGTDSWGALYMRDYINAEGFEIGLAAIFFNGFMVLGRLVGDRLKDHFGIYNFLKLSIFLSLSGTVSIAFSDNLYLSIFGFALSGFGVSSIIPICYTLASSVRNLDPTLGITIITIAVYGFFMFAPSLMGYIANNYGVQFVYFPIFLFFIISTFIAIFSKSLKAT
jgi:MFS family permease